MPGLPDDPTTNKERIIVLETKLSNIESDVREMRQEVKDGRIELLSQVKDLTVKVHTIDINVNKNIVLIGILMVAAQVAFQFFLK